jgi:hypothetical protein
VRFGFLTCNPPQWSYGIDDFYDDGKILLGLNREKPTDLTAAVSIDQSKDDTPVKKKKLKKKPKKLSAFENDCVLTLVSLGFKKSTAKSDVKLFLKNRNINTIEEFLQLYMKEKANVKNS